MPEVATCPDHAPEATQDVVLVEDQLSVVVPPDTTEAGLAEKERVAAGMTVMVVLCETLPPLPAQVSTYVLVADGVTVVVPDIALLPDHAPDAVQVVAAVVDHVNTLLLPAITELELGENERVGTAATDELAAEDAADELLELEELLTAAPLVTDEAAL